MLVFMDNLPKQTKNTHRPLQGYKRIWVGLRRYFPPLNIFLTSHIPIFQLGIFYGEKSLWGVNALKGATKYKVKVLSKDCI
jgi:hypothetical protein